MSLIVLALLLAACGGGDAGDDDAAVTTTAAAADDSGEEAETEEPETEEETEEPETEEPDDGSQGSGESGSATLTIGDQVYTFDNYYCLQGGENTGNDNVPFSSGAFGEVEGVRVQLDASLYDPDAQDRMEGDGVIHTVSLNDVEDFENPSVAWRAESGFLGMGDWVIQYDGETVFAEAMFDDDRTDEIEEIPGTLEAVCGDEF